MRRSLSVRIATLLFVATMAVPVFASVPRDDSPFDRIEQRITRVLHKLVKLLTPKPTDVPVGQPPVP